jgi:hypothetical protein
VYETPRQTEISVTFEKQMSVKADSGFIAHSGSMVSELPCDSLLWVNIL